MSHNASVNAYPQKPQAASFSRSLRLLSSSEFKNVFANTCFKASSRHLLLLACPNTQGHARIGFVLAKKQLKRAVDRNRVKRIVRESFRYIHCDLDNLDVVVLARTNLHRLDNQQLRQLIDGMWLKLKPIKHEKRHTRT